MNFKKLGEYSAVMALLAGCLMAVSTTAWAQDKAANKYVGSAVCQSCHEEQYTTFTAYARKSHSYESILKRIKGLTPVEVQGCYTCHTTGYGEPGGFVSPEKTPELKDAGCEVCHGPGKIHAESQDPRFIVRKVTIDVCQRCHIEERVQSFRYKPIIHAGCH
ncbi:MAG: cytochrome c family protein [Desulfobacterales bacterium]|jgi:hypothetical protein|nr:cytochrome c family protein [Desulfobacterales bacterium]MDD3082003.1 cytochrome c family protein [Desulfobacterales bacterium]MDD3949767.1 cytochrome c family protein [Desulfobacterales bacterium]MDD4463280.1 cytochrome c family protein [Desulfobacterales bacterium]MDY0377844.1 cytochrome c family protein [Desulfobacterales bacterium]